MKTGVTMDFSRPGKPTDNMLIESFNDRFRDECLNVHWRQEYNRQRLHSSLTNQTTEKFGRSLHQNCPWLDFYAYVLTQIAVRVAAFFLID